MTKASTEVPVKTEDKATEPWRSGQLSTLRREVDRLFEDFGRGGFLRSPFQRSVFDVEPFWREGLASATSPAIDFAEKKKAYEVTAELPGMDQKDIEVKLVNGELTIRGKKEEEKKEEKKDYYLHERHFGSFERRFRIPEGADTDKIEASFKNGVLTITLAKRPEAQKPEKTIEVKTAS